MKSVPAVNNDAGELCRSCALCCDGTLFSYVPLQPPEIEPMRKLGLHVSKRDGRTSFAQPCARLRGSACSIYDQRPAKCRSYRCRVLRRLQAGELAAQQAEAFVNKATTLLSKIHELSGDATMSVWKRLDELCEHEQLELQSVEFSRRFPTLGMHVVLLKKLVEDEFSVEAGHGLHG